MCRMGTRGSVSSPGPAPQWHRKRFGNQEGCKELPAALTLLHCQPCHRDGVRLRLCPAQGTARGRGTRSSPLLPRFHFGSENKPLVKQVPVMVTQRERPTFPVSARSTLGSHNHLAPLQTPLRLTHHPQLLPILPARKPRARNQPQGRDELPSPDGRSWGCCPLCLHHLIARLVPKMEWKIAVSISRPARAEAASHCRCRPALVPRDVESV